MKILMICLGNICRSPLAQGILEKKLIDHNLQWEVDSAGTASYHVGNPPDGRSIDKAAEYGIDISAQRSRKVRSADLDYFDLILAMDASNYNKLLELSSKAEHDQKIKMILNYSYPGINRQVPDPYYDDGFENVYRLLDEACDKLIAVEAKKV